MDGETLEKIYQESLEERIIAYLSETRNISLEEAMDTYYHSRLADKIHCGNEGIQYLDYKVLVQILCETELESEGFIRNYRKIIKILFICHGNICPMAEFVMKSMLASAGLSRSYVVASCATSTEEIGNDIHWGTRKKLREEGVPFSPRRAVQLRRSDYEHYDYLIGMDRNNIRNISRITGGDPDGKISLLMRFAGQDRDIADPWYTGDFDATYRDIHEGCAALLRYTREKGRETAE